MRLLLPLLACLLSAPVCHANECPEFQDVVGTMDDDLPSQFYSIATKEIDQGLYMVEVDFRLKPKDRELRNVSVRFGERGSISPSAVIPLHLLAENDEVRTGVFWADSAMYPRIVLMVTYDHLTTMDGAQCVGKRMTYVLNLPPEESID